MTFVVSKKSGNHNLNKQIYLPKLLNRLLSLGKGKSKKGIRRSSSRRVNCAHRSDQA
jgi:hypothetical protein